MPARKVGIYAKRNIIKLLAAVSLLLGSLLLAALTLGFLTAFALSLFAAGLLLSALSIGILTSLLLLAAGSLFFRAGVMFGAFRAFCLLGSLVGVLLRCVVAGCGGYEYAGCGDNK